MKKVNFNSKLQLRKEIVANLDSKQMSEVNGGATLYYCLHVENTVEKIKSVTICLEEPLKSRPIICETQPYNCLTQTY